MTAPDDPHEIALQAQLDQATATVREMVEQAVERFHALRADGQTAEACTNSLVALLELKAAERTPKAGRMLLALVAAVAIRMVAESRT